jgi:dihydroorotase
MYCQEIFQKYVKGKGSMSLMKEVVDMACGIPAELISDVTDFVSSHTLPVSKNPHYVVFPGFCDVHVHFREPGFSYKETVRTGCDAAAAGGYTAVCTMPNLSPVPDNPSALKEQLDIIESDAYISVYPYGSITMRQEGKELSDLEGMCDRVIAFSDDGKGVQNPSLMREAMLRAKQLGKMIVAHCEDNSLLRAGYIHDGAYAKAHGHRGICSESEWKPIERDLRLVEETGCAYHVCHISTKESVNLMREAKKKGLDVTCETAPHYLVLDDTCLEEDGRFKMNPPLRSSDDKKALLEGIADGTIDMIATDHAPHSAEEKSRGLEKSAFGIVGLETAVSVLYTHLVRNGIITMDKMVELLYTNPIKRFNINRNTGFSIWDMNAEYIVDPTRFKSKGRATPFEGHKLYGKCIYTVLNNKVIYENFDK